MSRRIALVTGASSGIGKATAVQLAGLGFDLGIGYCSDRSGAARTADAARAAGAGQVVVFALDLAAPTAAAATVDSVAEQLGGIDVLVNNAGLNRRSAFVDESLPGLNRILAVDFVGPFACAQVAARRMIAQGRGGRIVNVGSVHEMIPIRGGSAYCTAKAALGMLTKVMALELAEHGITVNAVSPGETATAMNGVPENVDAADIGRPWIPAGRPGRPAEVAALIAHLLEPAAAYTTGVSIPVDGGLMLMAAIANQAASTGQDSPNPTPEV